MIIAQLSDFHARPPGVLAYGGLDTNRLMRRAIDAVAALEPRPDCVVVTGDLSDDGLPDEYQAVADALADLPMPAYLIPGNHDRREVMRACLAGLYPYLRQDGPFLNYVVEDGPVRLIALDTIEPGGHGGAICAAREAWLAARLAEGGGRPTMILMHHPPFRTGVPAMDPMMCRSAPGLAALIARHPEIERIRTGHFHRTIAVRWAGTIGFVGPGTAHQVALDLRPGEPTRFIHEPPGFALHAYDAEAGIISHVVPLGDFGPILDFAPPSDDPGRP